MTKQQDQKLVSTRNKLGRPAGSRNKRTLLREALAETFEAGEPGFWRAVCQQAAGGDAQAMGMVAKRLIPELRPEVQPVEVPGLAEAPSLADKARAVLDAAGRGELSPSVASELISMLTSLARISEVTELEQRIAALEVRHGKN